MPKRRSDTMRAVDAVMPLVDEFNLLDEGDKLTFLDLVDPLPEKHDHRPKKKASKKSSKSSQQQQSSSKSPRASGMATQLSSRRQRQQKINEGACTFILEDGAICNTGDNNPIHDETFGYAAYHPFVSTAPPAPAPSSANGGVGSTTQNSEASAATAGAVTGGSSE